MSGRARFQQHPDASCYQVFFPLQGKAPKEIHGILEETICFLLGRAKDLPAPLYYGDPGLKYGSFEYFPAE